MSESARLVLQLRELLMRFAERGIRHAAIGGLAVNVHGYSRATQDIDFLIRSDDEEALHALMLDLAYEAIDRRADLSSYVRGGERADFLHARLGRSTQILRPVRARGSLR